MEFGWASVGMETSLSLRDKAVSLQSARARRAENATLC